MWTALIVIGAIIAIGYAWYAGLIRKRNRAREALSGIDVQLKKRSNVIPNILTIAQKFMDHERALLNEITALRARVDETYDPDSVKEVEQHLAMAERLGAKMGQLLITVEDYPQLKSDEHMLQAQRSYNEIEAQIAAARRFYNSSVTALNNAVEIFPGNIIAGIAGVLQMPYYETEEAARQPVSAGDHLR